MTLISRAADKTQTVIERADDERSFFCFGARARPVNDGGDPVVLNVCGAADGKASRPCDRRDSAVTAKQCRVRLSLSVVYYVYGVTERTRSVGSNSVT